MGKIKIYEIAKRLNVASKDILEIAKKLNIEVKNHMSSVTEEEETKIEKEMKGKDTKNKEKTAKKQVEHEKKEEKAPVIIRREVIISEEEKEKKEEAKQEEKKQTNIGFVERRKNKDFNIVYRNKPTKPKTVSELFGLNKTEEKTTEKKDIEQKEQKEDKTKIDVKKDIKKKEQISNMQEDNKIQKK